MKVLQITTSGMKNICNDIVVSFANSTIEKGIKKINNVKGIFGFNGAGKTAFISSVDLYRNIVLDPTYLMQASTTKKLDKLLNYSSKKFSFSIIYEYRENVVIKHSLMVEKNPANNFYFISFEDISLSAGRTLDDKYKLIINKSSGEVSFPSKGELFSGVLSYLKDAELDYSSVVSKVISKIISNNDYQLSVEEKILVTLFLNVRNIDVYLLKDDEHSDYIIDKEAINNLIKHTEHLKNKIDTWSDLYIDETAVQKEHIKEYEKENMRLEKFIKIFKPEVKAIVLDKVEDGNIYHVRKIFQYENYKVEMEFESSGIKQLVRLFAYLAKCSKGATVFVDEIDTNINTVYFTKLISFFRNYGKGQLIFTTHNVEAMNSLKTQSRSILVLGVDNNMDVWVGKGNKSPIKDYMDGFFPNSPMNVEDFDFVNVFLGDD